MWVLPVTVLIFVVAWLHIRRVERIKAQHKTLRAMKPTPVHQFLNPSFPDGPTTDNGPCPECPGRLKLHGMWSPGFGQLRCTSCDYTEDI